jgi:hypothetical protein
VVTSFGAISKCSSGGKPKMRPAAVVLAVLPCVGIGGAGALFGAARGVGSTGAVGVGVGAEGIGCGADGLGALGADPLGVEGAFGAVVVGAESGVRGPATPRSVAVVVVVRFRAVVAVVLVTLVTMAAVEVVSWLAVVPTVVVTVPTVDLVMVPTVVVTVPTVAAAAGGTVFVTVATAPPTTAPVDRVAPLTVPVAFVTVEVATAPVAFVAVEVAPETAPLALPTVEVAADTGAGAGGRAGAFTTGALTGEEAAGTGDVAAGTLGADGVERGVAAGVTPATPTDRGVVLGSGGVANALPAATKTITPIAAIMSARNFAAEIRTSSECIPGPAGFNPGASGFSRS